MTDKKIDKLNAENLESRVAPVVFDQPGGSDDHRKSDHKKFERTVDPGTTPPNDGDPTGPIEEPIL